MTKISILRVLSCVTVAALLCASASAEILKVVLNDTIQPITAEYIARALDEAKLRNDQAVLIEISTPGGLLDSTRKIIEKISNSPVPVILYVAPTGSRAGSAGIFILESADVAAMAPGTKAGGVSAVVRVGPGTGKTHDEMKQKSEND